MYTSLVFSHAGRVTNTYVAIIKCKQLTVSCYISSYRHAANLSLQIGILVNLFSVMICLTMIMYFAVIASVSTLTGCIEHLQGRILNAYGVALYATTFVSLVGWVS